MPSHPHSHAFESLHPRQREGLVIAGRRNFLKAGLAGLASLSLPALLRHQAQARSTGKPSPTGKSVILLWMAGGPSHLDTWDPKPSRPPENRGPFGVIRTRVPGVLVCEHLPKQAARMDRFTLIRSVDATHSNHEPNTVFQTANRDAEPRTNPRARLHPAIGSVVLSYHTASGTWDTHGDNIPPYGGILKGLKPLLPLFDHLLTTLVDDLAQRSKLDDVLVLAMGELDRTPKLGTQGSTDGRDHWPVVMSMALAGGGLRHGQVIGSTEKDGGHIATRPVTPMDLAATIYRHMGVPLDAEYVDGTGRPVPVVYNGQPIAELF